MHAIELPQTSEPAFLVVSPLLREQLDTRLTQMRARLGEIRAELAVRKAPVPE